MLAVYVGLLLLTDVYLLFIVPIPVQSAAPSILLVSSLLLCYLAILASLRMQANYNACCQGAILFTFVCITAGICMSGGPLESPSTVLLILPIVMAFCLAGRRSGILWSNLTVFTHLLAISINQWVYPFPQLLSDHTLPIHHLFHWIIAYSALVGLMLIYDTITQHLKEQRDEERQRYMYLAAHDPLTSLANRARFEEHLQHAMARSDRDKKTMALLIIDLDGFKQINDRFGHLAGDTVLKVISRRLEQAVRKSDTVSRIGGDEFAVILEDIREQNRESNDADSGGQDNTSVELIADKLLSTINQNIEDLGGGADYVSGSIGVALYPEHTRNKDRLFIYADEAMYRAKRHRNLWCIYSSTEELSDSIGEEVLPS